MHVRKMAYTISKALKCVVCSLILTYCYAHGIEMKFMFWRSVPLQVDRVFPSPNTTYEGIISSQECITNCMSTTYPSVSVTFTVSSMTCHCHMIDYEFETVLFNQIYGTTFFTTNPENTSIPVATNTTIENRTSCQAIFQSGITVSGVYRIEPVLGTSFDAYCNMTGGGWTYIQQRIDDADTFNRTYQEYTDGFGNINTNFWLGLEKIYLLTTTPRIVQFDLLTTAGTRYSVQYTGFSLANSTNFYRLTVLDYVAGDCYSVGNSFLVNNGYEFFAIDRDDPHLCIEKRKFGWWFKNCSYISINGLYGLLESYDGFVIYCNNVRVDLAASVMQIQ